MHGYDLIVTLTAGLGAALLLGYVTHRIGLAPIVGYLIAGTLVGPNTPGVAWIIRVLARASYLRDLPPLKQAGADSVFTGEGARAHDELSIETAKT